MKKAVIAGVSIAALAVVASRLYLAFLPEDAKVRRAIARVERAFNDGAALALASSLAADVGEEESRAGTADVRLVLFQYFRSQRDSRTGELRFAVEAPPEAIEVALEEGDPPAATVDVTARFFQRRGSERAPMCTVLFHARLVKVGGDWKIARARRKLLEGRYPF